SWGSPTSGGWTRRGKGSSCGATRSRQSEARRSFRRGRWGLHPTSQHATKGRSSREEANGGGHTQRLLPLDLNLAVGPPRDLDDHVDYLVVRLIGIERHIVPV